MLSFMENKDDGNVYAYSVELTFSRSIRFEPVFKTYLIHLCRLNFGPIGEDKAKDDNINVFGDSSASMSISSGASFGASLKVTFPRQPVRSQGAPSTTKPSYGELTVLKEADFPAPEGKPDVVKWLGLDRDHWGPAFLPALKQGMREEKTLALFEADWKMVRKPKKGDSAFVKFKPKAKDKYPGITLVEVYLTTDDSWEGRRLRSMTIEMDRRLLEDEAYFAYLTKLGEANFGDGEPEDPDEIMTWIGDHSEMAQLSKQGWSFTFGRY